MVMARMCGLSENVMRSGRTDINFAGYEHKTND